MAAAAAVPAVCVTGLRAVGGKEGEERRGEPLGTMQGMLYGKHSSVGTWAIYGADKGKGEWTARSCGVLRPGIWCPKAEEPSERLFQLLGKSHGSGMAIASNEESREG